MDINIRKIEEMKNNSAGERPRFGAAFRPAPAKPVASPDYWSAVSRWALIALAALAPIFFLPFTGLPVAAHKEVLVFGLVLIAFFALLGRILVEGKIRYPGHLFAASLALLVLVWGGAVIFSANPLTGLVGGWSSPDGFFSILFFAILAFSVAASFNRRDVEISLAAFLASLSILGLFEIFQLLKIFILPFGFAQNAGFNPIGSINSVGALLAFGLIIACGLVSAGASQSGAKWPKRLLIAAAAIFIFNLVVIDFWAIWIGLVLSSIIMIAFLSKNIEASGSEGLQLAYFRRAWLPSLVLLSALIFLFVPSPFSKIIQTPPEVFPSFGATWNIALFNFKAGHWLFGSGPGTFGYLFNLYKPDAINRTIFWSTVFMSGSSAVFSWLGTVGISGILAVLFLIFAFVFSGVKSAAVSDSSGETTGVISKSVFAAVIFIFTMWFLYSADFTVMVFAFWGMGIFAAASRSFAEEKSPRNGTTGAVFGNIPRAETANSGFKDLEIFTTPPRVFVFSLLTVALMVAAVAAFYFEANRYAAENYFTQGDYASAVKFWQYDDRYYRALAQNVFSQIGDLLSRKDLPADQLKSQFQNAAATAVAAAKQAQNLDPQDPSNGVLLGGIYENLIPYMAGSADFALSSYAAAVSVDPQNPAYYYDIARVEIAQADLAAKQNAPADAITGYLDKAAADLEKSMQLKNDYAPPRFLLVQVYDREGKLTDAVKRAEELVSLDANDVGSLFQLGFLYYKNNQFDQSKQVLERAVGLSPNYSNARYFLGLIYDKENPKDKSAALDQFEKILALNPDNTEVKKIIANLSSGKSALFGIAPPAPQNRNEPPVGNAKPLVPKIRK